MSTRSDASFLNDVLLASRKIERIVSGISQDSFFRDEIRQAAVLHHLTVIGEAIHRLAPALKQKYPGIPWQQIVSVRHRIAHAYFDLDWQILWTSAKEDVPELGARVAEILRNDFGNELTALDDPA